MSTLPRLVLALSVPLCCLRFAEIAAAATEGPAAAAAAAATATATATADFEIVRRDFVTAMQRVHQHLPDTEDSPALKSYVIYDYLVAARFRRDLSAKTDATVDAAIDSFLQAHAGQPVSHGLRHDWLVNLADRHRWELFLARSTEVTDPSLICDRLTARLAGGDTDGLGAAVLERWSQPQKQPAECDGVLAWLRQQNLVTPALAEARTRAALAADNPRLARVFAADVPPARAASLLQWSDLLESPKAALLVLAGHPALTVEPDALAAGFEKLANTESTETRWQFFPNSSPAATSPPLCNPGCSAPPRSSPPTTTIRNRCRRSTA